MQPKAIPLRIKKRYLVAAGLALLTWLLQQSPLWVERIYATGFYPVWASVLDAITGWTSISLGDILYAAIASWLLIETISYALRFARKIEVRKQWKSTLIRLAYKLVVLWLVFQWSWGLNYHRAGSAHQLDLQAPAFSPTHLGRLCDTLNSRLALTIPQLTATDTATWYQLKVLQQSATVGYRYAAQQFPFLQRPHEPVKRSLFSFAGGYGGFSGYFNPFTGESQIVGNIPPFQRAFVSSHELAHQYGYAAEQEANLVGFLAAAHHPSPAARYSAYHDMLTYTLGELRASDTLSFKRKWEQVHPLVKQHIRQAKDYTRRYRHRGQRLINAWYNFYLKWNKQERGLESYSYVTAWLIAYAEKYGWEKL